MFADHDSVTILTLLGVPVTLSSIGLLGVHFFFYFCAVGAYGVNIVGKHREREEPHLFPRSSSVVVLFSYSESHAMGILGVRRDPLHAVS